MSEEWICDNCICFGTDACYCREIDAKTPACNKVVVDEEKEHEKAGGKNDP